MNEQGARDPQAVAAAFAEHLRAFHGSLPPDEQPLLEQVVALAEAVVRAQDTAGYFNYSKIEQEYPGGVNLTAMQLALSSLAESKFAFSWGQKFEASIKIVG